MKTEEELIWESYVDNDNILIESPWEIPSGFEGESNKLEELDINEIKNNTTLISKLDDIQIYYSDISNEKEYFFIDDNKIVAYYRFSIIDQYKIETKMIWNSKNNKGIFRKLFLDFILPKYKNIVSDQIMSKFGFSFWEKLINQQYINISVILPNGDVIKIDSNSDMQKYKEKLNTDFKFSRFIIQYEK
jgi:hypothetical protein